MIDRESVGRMLRREGLDAWADRVDAQLAQVLELAPHGDWTRWQDALGRLPVLRGGRVDDDNGVLRLRPEHSRDGDSQALLREALQVLHPWRKGPYEIADVYIDTEWRSDWKWDRVLPHIESLDGRLVLDVGCGNGYHCWRMALAGARQVIGIDPTALFLAQFLAVRQLVAAIDAELAARVELLPVGVEGVPAELRRFDTVFSMGVMYHRRSPIDHLVELRGALRRGGQLVLETLVIDGDDQRVLVPRGRYAKMRNVWFIPATGLLETWLARAGFSDVRTVDINVTGLDEQRSTDWMTFESLADFLDPADRGMTVEGHPAPRRAIVTAHAG